MEKEKRSHRGYEIIESCTIGSAEFVIGYNRNAIYSYVCWICKDKTEYMLGRYSQTIEKARSEMHLRVQIERSHLGGTHPSASKK